MTLKEAEALLRFRQSIEGAVFDDIDAQSWALCLEGVGYTEALKAAVEHYRESLEPLKPAHILKRA